ncbi:Protein of unknown function [Gryllus bimaculatus]|nr:Protein of unknown function [Gryllus bimaculatus]
MWQQSVCRRAAARRAFAHSRIFRPAFAEFAERRDPFALRRAAGGAAAEAVEAAAAGGCCQTARRAVADVAVSAVQESARRSGRRAGVSNSEPLSAVPQSGRRGSHRTFTGGLWVIVPPCSAAWDFRRRLRPRSLALEKKRQRRLDAVRMKGVQSRGPLLLDDFPFSSKVRADMCHGVQTAFEGTTVYFY